MADKEDRYDRAGRHLLSRAAVNGYSVAAVDDGHVFCFTRDYVQGLLDMMDDQGKSELLMFVQHGKTFDGTDEN